MNQKILAIICLITLFIFGCGSMTIKTQAPEGPPVTIKTSYAARGCIAVDVDPKTGVISIIHKQDGESNWAPWRVIPAMGAMVLVLMGKLPVIGGIIPVLGPSDTGGCVGIMADDLDVDKDKPADPNVIRDLIYERLYPTTNL